MTISRLSSVLGKMTTGAINSAANVYNSYYPKKKPEPVKQDASSSAHSQQKAPVNVPASVEQWVSVFDPSPQQEPVLGEQVVRSDESPLEMFMDVVASDNPQHTNLVWSGFREKNKFSLFQLSNFRGNLFQSQIPLFFQHVMTGKQQTVETLLKQFPQLLLCKASVCDLSGRNLVERSGFQIALGAQDVGMWKMMELYFNQLKEGQAEKVRQFNEQFPEDASDRCDEYDFKALINVIIEDQFIDSDAVENDWHNVIKDTDKDRMNEETQKALHAFVEHFTPKPTDNFTTGKHFDMQIYLRALDMYVKNFHYFKSSEQRAFYCRRVLGFLQGLFTACWAQASNQGLDSVVNKGETLSRSLKFKLSHSHSVLPRDPVREFRLGEGCYVEMVNGGQVVCELAEKWAKKISGLLNTYLEQKQREKERLRIECREGMTIEPPRASSSSPK